MSFSCPHFDIERNYCLRLKTDCVPGRPGCVLVGAVFATPVEQRLRELEEEKRRRVILDAILNEEKTRRC
jgi:hypothetical protein